VLAHSIRDQPVDQATIAAIKARDVEYIPTLTRDIAQFIYEGTPPYFADAFFTRHIPESYYSAEMAKLKDPANQEKIKKDQTAQTTKTWLAQGRKNLKTLSDAGVTIALGTDTGTNEGQWQGYFEHVELEEMVKVWTHADAGARRRDERRGEGGERSAAARDDCHRQAGRPARAQREPVDRHPQHRQIQSVWIAGRRLASVNATN
jgi:hypothetical protein